MLYAKGNIVSLLSTEPSQQDVLYQFIKHYNKSTERADIPLIAFLSDGHVALKLLYQIAEYLLFDEQTPLKTIEQHIGIINAFNRQLMTDFAQKLVETQQNGKINSPLSNTDKALIQISDIIIFATNQMILHALTQINNPDIELEELRQEFQNECFSTETGLTIIDEEYLGIENPLVIAIAALYKHQLETTDPVFQRFIASFDALEQPLFMTLRNIVPFILWQEEDPQTTNTRLKIAFNALLQMRPEKLGQLIVYHPHILATALYHYHIKQPKEAEVIFMSVDQIISQINQPDPIQQQGYFYFLIHIHHLQQNYYVGITEDRLENFQSKCHAFSALHPNLPKPFFCILEKNTATLHTMVMEQTLSIQLSTAQVQELARILPQIDDQTQPNYACITKIQEYSGHALQFKNINGTLIDHCLNKGIDIQPELQSHIQSPALLYNDFLLACAIVLASCPAIQRRNKVAIFTHIQNTNPPHDLVTGWWSILKQYPLVSKKILYPDLSKDFIQTLEKFEALLGHQLFKYITQSSKHLTVYLDLLCAWYPATASEAKPSTSFLVMYATYIAEFCNDIAAGWKTNILVSPIQITILFKKILQLSLEHQTFIFKNLIHLTPELQPFMMTYLPETKKVYAIDAHKLKDLPQQLLPHLHLSKDSFLHLRKKPDQLPSTIATPEFACTFFLLLSIANQSFTTKIEQKMYTHWKKFFMAALIDILQYHANSPIALVFQNILQKAQIMSILPEQTQNEFLWAMYPETAQQNEKLLLEADQKTALSVKKTAPKKLKIRQPTASSEQAQSTQPSPPIIIDEPYMRLEPAEVFSTESTPTPIVQLSSEGSVDTVEKSPNRAPLTHRNSLTQIQNTFGQNIHRTLLQFLHLQKQIRALPKTSAATPVSEIGLQEKWSALLPVVQESLSFLFPFATPLLQQSNPKPKQSQLNREHAIQIENTWNKVISQLQTLIEKIMLWENIQEDKPLIAELFLCHRALSQGGYYRHPHRYLPVHLLHCLETINTLAIEHDFQMFVKGSTCLSENPITTQQDIDLVFFSQSTHYPLQTINAFVEKIRHSLRGESKSIHSNPNENYYQMRVSIPLSAEPSCSVANVHTIVQDMDWTFLLTPKLDPIAYTQKALVSPAAILWDIQTGRQWMLAKTASAIFREPRLFCIISATEQAELISKDKIGYVCKQWITHADWHIDPLFQTNVIDPLFVQSAPTLTAEGQEHTQQLLQATLRYLLMPDRFKASCKPIIDFIHHYQLLIKAYPWEKSTLLTAQKIPHACHTSFLKYFYPALQNPNLPALSSIEFIALYCIAGILDKSLPIKEALIDFLKEIQKTLPVNFEPLLKIIISAPQESYAWSLLSNTHSQKPHSGSQNTNWSALLAYWHIQIQDFQPTDQQSEPTTIPVSSSNIQRNHTVFFQPFLPPVPKEQPEITQPEVKTATSFL